jgi:hypothetical protein
LEIKVVKKIEIVERFGVSKGRVKNPEFEGFPVSSS